MLRDKVKAVGFTDLAADERTEYHAYHYAWRRDRLGDFSTRYALDPNGEHYDAGFVERAVEFYCRLAGRKYQRPAPEGAQPARTAAEIEHVANCTQQILKNLAALDERNRNTFGGSYDADRNALRRVREELGFSAIEQPEEIPSS